TVICARLLLIRRGPAAPPICDRRISPRLSLLSNRPTPRTNHRGQGYRRYDASTEPRSSLPVPSSRSLSVTDFVNRDCDLGLRQTVSVFTLSCATPLDFV